MGIPLALAQQRPIFLPEERPLAAVLLEEEDEDEEEEDEAEDESSDCESDLDEELDCE